MGAPALEDRATARFLFANCRDRDIIAARVLSAVPMSSELIAVGQSAPDFSLPASTGASPLSLAELRGKIVVLAFYVLDFTST